MLYASNSFVDQSLPDFAERISFAIPPSCELRQLSTGDVMVGVTRDGAQTLRLPTHVITAATRFDLSGLAYPTFSIMGKPLDTSFEQSNSLTVRDNRTGRLYTIPCVRRYRRGLETHPFPSIQDNSIQATAFKAVKAPLSQSDREENETDKGLRIADKGYLNTAVIRSEITY